YAFRPRRDGALLRCEGDFPDVFAHAGGGRSMPASSGRVFEPTDMEVGPDGALLHADYKVKAVGDAARVLALLG
ncbi:MAG: hypothetical protein ACPGN4_06445, partial [Miltoncostaeaceae bacterium]